jgi:hypothetical protein
MLDAVCIPSHGDCCLVLGCQIMSTEDVQDQHCAAFEAAMDCINALLLEELQSEPVATIRMIVPQSQVGAIMGKGGSSIK